MKNDKFISRLTGEITEKGDRKTLNEMPDNNSLINSFSLVSECFKMNDIHLDDNPIKYLYQEWNFPKETIKEIFNGFGKSFDETNDFLRRLDGSDSLEEAWDSFVEDNNCTPDCPFDLNLKLK